VTMRENETDPYQILRDSVAQHLTLIGCIPTDMNGDEALSCVYESAGDLDFALGLAKEAAAGDFGSVAIRLTLEEVHVVRCALARHAERVEKAEGEDAAAPIWGVRKRITKEQVARCEARTTTTEQHFAPRPADAVASSDDEEVAA